jgi:hypothetical protein
MTTNGINDTEEQPVSFSQFLHTVADGDCHREATEQLREVAQSLRKIVQTTKGKIKAELKLVFKFTTDGGGVVDVDYDIERKEPKPLRLKSALWLTRQGNFTGEAPRQESLNLTPLRDEGKATS